MAIWYSLRVRISREPGRRWSDAIPLDISCYRHRGGVLLPDQSILISYCESGRTPNCVYVLRFCVNTVRNGVELMMVGG